MKRNLIGLGMASTALLLMGCGPRLDADSPQALESSLEAMSAELEGEEKQEFETAIAAISMEAMGEGMGSMLVDALSGDQASVEAKAEETMLEAMREYEGMSASQIIKEAKQLESWDTMKNLGGLSEAFEGMAEGFGAPPQ
jgi:hypothetical protein